MEEEPLPGKFKTDSSMAREADRKGCHPASLEIGAAALEPDAASNEMFRNQTLGVEAGRIGLKEKSRNSALKHS